MNQLPLDINLSMTKSRYGEDYIPAVNGTAFELYDSHQLYTKNFLPFLKRKNTLFIIIGSDSGLFIKYLVEKSEPSSIYVVVEFEEVIRQIGSNNILPALPGNIHVVDVDKWIELAENLDFQSYVFMNAIQVLTSFASIDANLPEYAALTRKIEDEYFMLRLRTEVHYGVKAFVQVQLDNVCENVIPAIHLKKLFHGKTAVILAGGPSVNSSFEWVRKNRDKVVVIAVSRIARILKNADLKPDIFISLDPYKENLATSEGLLEFDDVLLVNGNHLESRLLSQWRGPSMYLGSRLPWVSDNNVDGNIQLPGPTVANSAIHLAMEMACHNIILSGVDLCFSAEGFTHAEGTQEHSVGPRVGFSGRRVKTYSGVDASTIPAFDMARATFEAQAQIAREVGIKIFNVNERAAYINGIPFMAYLDIPLADRDIGASEKLMNIYREQFRSKNTLKTDAENILKELSSARHDFMKMKKLCNEALEINGKMYEKYDIENFRHYKKKMDKIEDGLTNHFSSKANIIQSFGLAHFAKFVRPDSFEWTSDEMEEVGKIYYEAYISSIEQLVELIDVAIERAEVRVEESSDSPDFGLVFSQWRKDRQPGRAVVWMKRFPESYSALSINTKNEFDRLGEEYQKLMDETRDWWKTTLATENSTDDIASKMWNLFRRGDLEQLIVLKNSLQARPRADFNLNILEGLIAELNNDAAAAYEAYVRVLEKGQDLVIMQRKAFCELALKDYDAALDTLKDISTQVPYYQTKYADLLKALGKVQDSIDEYTDYLQHSPNDYDSFVRLGEIYQEIGVREGVDWIISHVQKHDPENKAVHRLMHN